MCQQWPSPASNVCQVEPLPCLHHKQYSLPSCSCAHSPCNNSRFLWHLVSISICLSRNWFPRLSWKTTGQDCQDVSGSGWSLSYSWLSGPIFLSCWTGTSRHCLLRRLARIHQRSVSCSLLCRDWCVQISSLVSICGRQLVSINRFSSSWIP